METQTQLSRHNKFISTENIIAILSVLSDDSLHAFLQIYIYHPIPSNCFLSPHYKTQIFSQENNDKE